MDTAGCGGMGLRQLQAVDRQDGGAGMTYRQRAEQRLRALALRYSVGTSPAEVRQELMATRARVLDKLERNRDRLTDAGVRLMERCAESLREDAE